MKRIAVISTTMKSVGYDISKKILEIEFIDGEIYQYYDVPDGIYAEFMNSDSLGKYLNEQIKTKNYEFKKIT